MKLLLAAAAFAVAVILVPVALAQRYALHGHVYDASRGTGIAGLTLKLVPTAGQKSEYVTSTNDDGSYRFDGVVEGSYALELIQGLAPVYRTDIHIAGDTTKEIRLEVRK